MKTSQRVLSCLLSLLLIVSIVPFNAIEVLAEQAKSTPVEFSTISGQIFDGDGIGVTGVSVQLYNNDENVILTLCQTLSTT